MMSYYKKYIVVFRKNGQQVVASGVISKSAAEFQKTSWEYYWGAATKKEDREISKTVEILEYIWGG